MVRTMEDLHCSPPSPCERLCNRYCSNTNTHIGVVKGGLQMRTACNRYCSNKHTSRSPDGWDQIPPWAGGWVLHQPPWSFGFDSQTRGTRETRSPPCVKVPGSSRVPLHLPPREQLYQRYCSNKHTHGQTSLHTQKKSTQASARRLS